MLFILVDIKYILLSFEENMVPTFAIRNTYAYYSKLRKVYYCELTNPC